MGDVFFSVDQTILQITQIMLIYCHVIWQSNNLIYIKSSVVGSLKLIVLIEMNLRQRRMLQIVLGHRCLFCGNWTILITLHKTLHDHLRLPMLL